MPLGVIIRIHAKHNILLTLEHQTFPWILPSTVGEESIDINLIVTAYRDVEYYWNSQGTKLKTELNLMGKMIIPIINWKKKLFQEKVQCKIVQNNVVNHDLSNN